MKTVRCFLAVNLEIETVTKIQQVQRQLIARDDGGNVKWVPPQNMHVTVRYLGGITEPMISAIKDAMLRVTRDTAPFTIRAKGVGMLGDSFSPQVLYVGIESAGDYLVSFYDGVCEVLEKSGFKQDARPFQSHLTIGRVTPGREAVAEDLISPVTDELFGDSSVGSLLCYHSALSSAGSDYALLWHLPLQGRRARRDQHASRSDADQQDTHEKTVSADGTPSKTVAEMSTNESQ